MDELKAYRDRRLELGDMIRAALHMARVSGDEEAEKRARELLVRLADDRFQLAVVGQFSRGKTTLMNALLGGAYLPMGALPMTSVITKVRYGSRPRALVRRRASSLPVEVPLADVAEFIGSSGAERAELQVATVEVEVPAEILRLGFELVDTPLPRKPCGRRGTTPQRRMHPDGIGCARTADFPGPAGPGSRPAPDG